MIKTLLTGTCLTLLLHASFAQIPEIRWSFSNSQVNGTISSVAELPSGNVAIVGYTIGEPYNTNQWMGVLDKNGELVWSKTFESNDDEAANAVAIDADGNMVVVGYIHGNTLTPYTGAKGGRDASVIKLNPTNGEVIWAKRYGGQSRDAADGLVITPNGDYLIVGYTVSSENQDISETNNGARDAWVLKINKEGNILSSHVYGYSNWDFGYSVIPTSDGGYVFGGITDDNDTGNDPWVVKVASNNTLEWEYKPTNTTLDTDVVVYPAHDGGYWVTYSQFTHADNATATSGEEDPVVVKLGSTGTVEWTKQLAGTPFSDYVKGFPSEDGSFLLAISKSTKPEATEHAKSIYILQIDEDGSTLHTDSIVGSTDPWGYRAHSIIQTKDGALVIGGYSITDNQLTPYVVRLGDIPTNTTAAENTKVRVYPNPAVHTMTVYLEKPSAITLRNVDGRKVKSMKGEVGENTLAVENLPAGVYTLQTHQGATKVIINQ